MVACDNEQEVTEEEVKFRKELPLVQLQHQPQYTVAIKPITLSRIHQSLKSQTS